MNRLAPKFPTTKFLKAISTTCIPNYPDKVSQLLMSLETHNVWFVIFLNVSFVNFLTSCSAAESSHHLRVLRGPNEGSDGRAHGVPRDEPDWSRVRVPSGKDRRHQDWDQGRPEAQGEGCHDVFAERGQGWPLWWWRLVITDTFDVTCAFFNLYFYFI